MSPHNPGSACRPGCAHRSEGRSAGRNGNNADESRRPGGPRRGRDLYSGKTSATSVMARRLRRLAESATAASPATAASAAASPTAAEATSAKATTAEARPTAPAPAAAAAPASAGECLACRVEEIEERTGRRLQRPPGAVTEVLQIRHVPGRATAA